MLREKWDKRVLTINGKRRFYWKAMASRIIWKHVLKGFHKVELFLKYVCEVYQL